MDTTNRKTTFGERAVGVSFNPGGLETVNSIKATCAAAIDELHKQRELVRTKLDKTEDDGERMALYTLAIRNLQTGVMYGVKAATW